MSGPLREINKRVAITLFGKNGRIAVPFIFRHRVPFMPEQQEGQPLQFKLILLVVYQPGITYQEVEHGTGDGALSGIRLEPVAQTFTTLTARGFAKIFEVEVGDIAAKTVTAALASEEMVQVSTHGLFVGKPGLGHDMFAIVGQLRFKQRHKPSDCRIRCK